MAELIDKEAITRSRELTKVIEVYELTPYLNVEDLIKFVDNLPSVTEAEIRYKAITDFLQFVCDNANNEKYDNDDGWALSDLIDLEFKYLEQLKERE